MEEEGHGCSQRYTIRREDITVNIECNVRGGRKLQSMHSVQHGEEDIQRVAFKEGRKIIHSILHNMVREGNITISCIRHRRNRGNNSL